MMAEEQNDDFTPGILGVDPQEEQPDGNDLNEAIQETQEEEQQEAPEETQEKPEGLSPQQLEAMQEKARIYDMIDNDPELTQKVVDHFRHRNGVAPTQRQEQSTEDQPNAPEIAKLQQKISAMENGIKQLIAINQVTEFQAAHPDFKDYRQDVGKLLSKHPTYTLEEAYEHVKAAKAGRPTSPSRVPRARAEGSPTRAGNKESDLNAMMRRIVDRNAVKSDDEAFDLALQAARSQHRE
jgi:hypothetical protein